MKFDDDPMAVDSNNPDPFGFLAQRWTEDDEEDDFETLINGDEPLTENERQLLKKFMKSEEMQAIVQHLEDSITSQIESKTLTSPYEHDYHSMKKIYCAEIDRLKEENEAQLEHFRKVRDEIELESVQYQDRLHDLQVGVVKTLNVIEEQLKRSMYADITKMLKYVKSDLEANTCLYAEDSWTKEELLNGKTESVEATISKDFGFDLNLAAYDMANYMTGVTGQEYIPENNYRELVKDIYQDSLRERQLLVERLRGAETKLEAYKAGRVVTLDNGGEVAPFVPVDPKIVPVSHEHTMPQHTSSLGGHVQNLSFKKPTSEPHPHSPSEPAHPHDA